MMGEDEPIVPASEIRPEWRAIYMHHGYCVVYEDDDEHAYKVLIDRATGQPSPVIVPPRAASRPRPSPPALANQPAQAPRFYRSQGATRP